MPGLVVARDDETVDPSSWGTATPVDPGKHHVYATAPGRLRWDTEVVIEPGPGARSIRIPILPPVIPDPPGTPTAETPREATPAADEGTTKRGGGRSTQKVLALTAGGVGVVGVGIGIAFGLKSKSRHDEAEQHCDGSACRGLGGVNLKSEAITAGSVATVGLVVGLAGLVGGTVLWLKAGSAQNGAPRHK